MSDSPDLLLLSTAYGVGGTERAILNLAQGLQPDFVVCTIFPHVDAEMGALVLAKQMGVTVSTSRRIRDLAVRRNYRDLLALRELVRSTKARSVNIHYGINFISIWDILAIRLAGAKRCVASVHHAVPITNARIRLMTRLAGKFCTSIVVTTPAMTEILVAAGVDQHKIVEIPLGVRIPTDMPRQADARLTLGLPQDALIIGSLGRLVTSKGFDDLITGLALMKTVSQPVHLAIGGDGPMRASLEVQAKAALGDRAHFLGHVTDPALLYAASDVFALSSHEEGFGIVFIEAAFYGLPSVGTNVGGVSYAISHNKTGLLIPDRDPPALAEALHQLLTNESLRKSMGQAAQQQAHDHFSEHVMINRYKQVLFNHNTKH
jgi:glycosyltransferase involved in cell wall biosynthesis